MKPKLVYKYRSGDETTFKRDLHSLEENCFYAPNFARLNDPCETLVFKEHFDVQVGLFSKLLGSNSRPHVEKIDEVLQRMIDRRNEIGIFSLSGTYKDELLWAHYANSHFGFCIEYDLDVLTKAYKADKIYSFPVSYSNSPPQISLNDLLDKEGISIIRKIAGNKSKRWEYEKEHRIIVNRFGEKAYDFTAVKSIYFGIRMQVKEKTEIMKRLQGRGINYFQMVQKSKSYSFEAEPIDDIYPRKLTYLQEIPASITGGPPVRFVIDKKDFFWVNGKATIDITLDSKVNKESLEWLANLIRTHIFKSAERIFMFYKIKGEAVNGGCWAASHFMDGEIEVSINNFIDI